MARRVENQLLLHQLYRTCNGDLPEIFKKKKMQGKCNERKIPPPIISKKRTNNQKKQKQNKLFFCSSVHPRMKTDFMQTVNLLTMECLLQLRVEGSNNLLSLFFNKKLKKTYLFFKTRFKVFF